MNKMYQMAMMFAMMGSTMPESHRINFSEKFTKEELEAIEEVRQARLWEIKKKKGLKEFRINGVWVLALNQKNAERKVANIEKKIALINH